MGIDLLELSIGIEREFGVDLEREFWSRETTFGNVVDEVMRRYDMHKVEREIASTHDETLKELCDEIKRILSTNRDVNENTRFAAIIPFWRRGKFWLSLRERFPMLEPLNAYRNRQLINLFSIEPFFFFGGLLFCSLCSIVDNVILQYLFGTLGIIGLVGFFATFPLAVRNHLLIMPYKRIGDAAQMITEKRCRFEELQRGNPDEFEAALREIFCAVLFIKPEKVTREATLYKDLGVE